MDDNTILVVDDSIINLNILENLLDGYDVIETTNGKSALSILEKEDVHLILLDIVMPEVDGYEICQKIKENEKTKNIPVVFITAKTDEDSIEKAYDVGGSDFVTKPFKPKELLARVKTQLKIHKMEKELRLLALIDPMTKLYNRRYFTSITEHSISFAQRERQELSVIMIDIDDFKNINDTYGHQIGDDVIVLVANTLMKIQRKSDIVCRYGGEEFVILLPNTSLENAKKVAEHARKEVESLSVSDSSQQEISFTISLGVSCVNVDDEETIEKSLKRADDALYNAKKLGKNLTFAL